MPYTIKERDGKKIVTGTYIPNGHTCKCKECKFMVEVPKCATDLQISGIVKMIMG